MWPGEGTGQPAELVLPGAAGDGTTVVWQLATREAVASFPGTGSAVSPAGATLASLDPAADTVTVRDADTLARLGTYPADVASSADLAYRPDGMMIAVTSGVISASLVPTVAVVDLAARTTHPIGGTSGTGPVAYSAANEVATDSDLIPAASTAAPSPTRRSPRIAAESIAFDPAGGLMAVGGSWPDGSGGDVLLLDIGTVALPARVMPPSQAPASPAGAPASALSPDGRTLAVTGPAGAVDLVGAPADSPGEVQLGGCAMAGSGPVRPKSSAQPVTAGQCPAAG